MYAKSARMETRGVSPLQEELYTRRKSEREEQGKRKEEGSVTSSGRAGWTTSTDRFVAVASRRRARHLRRAYIASVRECASV